MFLSNNHALTQQTLVPEFPQRPVQGACYLGLAIVASSVTPRRHRYMFAICHQISKGCSNIVCTLSPVLAKCQKEKSSTDRLGHDPVGCQIWAVSRSTTSIYAHVNHRMANSLSTSGINDQRLLPTLLALCISLSAAWPESYKHAIFSGSRGNQHSSVIGSCLHWPFGPSRQSLHSPALCIWLA